VSEACCAGYTSVTWQALCAVATARSLHCCISAVWRCAANVVSFQRGTAGLLSWHVHVVLQPRPSPGLVTETRREHVCRCGGNSPHCTADTVVRRSKTPHTTQGVTRHWWGAAGTLLLVATKHTLQGNSCAAQLSFQTAPAAQHTRRTARGQPSKGGTPTVVSPPEGRPSAAAAATELCSGPHG
jgi:hypothetical protein